MTQASSRCAIRFLRPIILCARHISYWHDQCDKLGDIDYFLARFVAEVICVLGVHVPYSLSRNIF